MDTNLSSDSIPTTSSKSWWSMPNLPTQVLDIDAYRFRIHTRFQCWRGWPLLGSVLSFVWYLTGARVGVVITVNRITTVPINRLQLTTHLVPPGGSGMTISDQVLNDIKWPLMVVTPRTYLAESGEYRYDFYLAIPGRSQGVPIADFTVRSKDDVTWALFIALLAIGGATLGSWLVR